MPSPYQHAYDRSLSDPEGFWAEAAEAIDWYGKPDKILDRSRKPFYRWFTGGRLNTCYNALDRHVANGRAQQTALIHDSPVTGTVSRYSYAELCDVVARCAGALRQQEVAQGDRVIIYMPMVPETVIAMLACARIGAIHSVVFGGFAARELATRIDDSKPRLIISASCGIEPGRIVPYKPLLDEAITIARHKPQRCLLLQRPQAEAAMIPGRDLDFREALDAAEPAECVPVEATSPLYILYTSGTTGIPKGVVRDHGGHAVAMQWSMKHVYDVASGDVYWAASDVGWVVGHSYIVYGPLLSGCTTVLYEGKPVGTPDGGAFWRVISDHKVNVMFTAPTAIRAIKREDPKGELVRRYDLASLRTLFLAGERSDPDTLKWSQATLGVPVIDHWWQTETGWAIAANCMGIEPLPVKHGSPTVAVPGYSVHVLDENGNEARASVTGNLTVKLPMPPGCLTTLWEHDDRFIDSYLKRYPGYYLTADAGFKDEDGYLWIMARIDDIINVAGHRLSTGAIEEVLSSHPDVAECAVIGAADALKGQVPVGLVVMVNGAQATRQDLAPQLIQLVRDQIGPVASLKQVTVVDRLPKTRSGKILRGTMKKIADSAEYRMPATIDDPKILDEIAEALKAIGYPQRSPPQA